MSTGEPLLEAADIQGHILTGFGRAFEMLLGLRFEVGDIDEIKGQLRVIAEEVTTTTSSAEAKRMRRQAALAGAVELAPVPLSLAIAFSQAGLTKFGGNPARIVDPIFQMGPARSAAALGDSVDAEGNPAGWQFGNSRDREPDVLLIIASASEAEVLDAAERYVQQLGECEIVIRECGRRIARDAEHFGFIDGISQPGVRGRTDEHTLLTTRAYPTDHPQAAMWSRPGQRLTWPGQFVFGYPSLDPDAIQLPGPIAGENDPFLRNGSLLVVRRLSQDVNLFWRAMGALAAELSVRTGTEWTAEKAAARCMGRWRDGTPVSLSPDKEDPAIVDNFYRRNGFKFVAPVGAATLTDDDGDHQFPGAGADPQGVGCPFFGHIRKVNPRDQSHDFGGVGSTLRSQMLRRGIPFGPDWSGIEDGADRGLMFMSYQTSIQHGFFRLMNEWVTDSARPIPGGIDPIIGRSPVGGRRLLLPWRGEQIQVTVDGDFVRATGAGYFFTPGIKVLRRLVS